MKKSIALILSLIFILLAFSGCSKKEKIVFRGWIDDNAALYVKINKMNRFEVRNLIGNPSAKILDENCEIFLKENGEALLVSYNADGLVTKLQSEDLAKISADSNARKRCEIMNKILGRTKEELIKRYGEPDEKNEKDNVIIYDNAFDVRVRIKFDENQKAQKIFAEGINNEIIVKNPNETITLPENPLDDFEAFDKVASGMYEKDLISLLGQPQGFFKYQKIRVYFDSNKNCIFIKCDEDKKVENIEKMTYLEAMENQVKNRKAWMVLLMNEFIGKSRKEVNEKYHVEYINQNARTYGYDDIVSSMVYLTYSKEDDTVEKVTIN